MDKTKVRVVIDNIDFELNDWNAIQKLILVLELRRTLLVTELDIKDQMEKNRKRNHIGEHARSKQKIYGI